MTITLRDLISRRSDPLQLSSLTGELGLDRPIPDPEVASPGLALAGYTSRFAPKRLHVLGETEISYLNSLTADERRGIESGAGGRRLEVEHENPERHQADERGEKVHPRCPGRTAA